MNVLAFRALILGAACALGASASAQVTYVVGLDSAGALPVNGLAYRPSITPDGRFVVFSSNASLVPGDTNGFGDVYVRDRLLGTTEWASIGTGGIQGNWGGDVPVISADGRFVAFQSMSTNLVPGDTNGVHDLFLRDRQNGTLERISVSTSGTQADNFTAYSSISADGRFIAFESVATNLVTGDTNGVMDIFLRDMQLGTTERVNVSSGGLEADGASRFPALSADGHFLVFQSDATNLVPGDTNGVRDIFLRDLQLGTTIRVSVDSAGAESDGASNDPSISANGLYVTFRSFATNLDVGDTNGCDDEFVHDLQTGATERISWTDINREIHAPCIGRGPVSDDGRYVLFTTYSDNVVAGDTNNDYDLFLRDRLTATTELVSITLDGLPGNALTAWPEFATCMTPDGRYVAFASYSKNLYPNDTDSCDALVRDRFGGPEYSSLCEPGAGGVIACPCGNPPSGANRGCDNKAATGGASLTGTGLNSLANPTLFFTSAAESPTAFSVMIQGTVITAGTPFGHGVRCMTSFKRLYKKNASAGSTTMPDLPGGELNLPAKSASKGDTILPGENRIYQVYYRDTTLLFPGCPLVDSQFNSTNAVEVTWQP